MEKGLILSRDDRIRRTVIMRLMCDLELDFNEISTVIGEDFASTFSHVLEDMDEFAADGLLNVANGKLTITEQGRLFIRNIAMNFDAYLEKGIGRYSKTI